MITLTLTYFLQVYNALHRRNTFALSLHHATAGTGDAARLLAGLGPGGDFHNADRELSEMARDVLSLYESHHFYTSLLYFHFRGREYAPPRIAILTMDLVTLIRSALDDRPYRSLKRSGAVEQVWGAGLYMLSALSRTYLPAGDPGAHHEPDAETAERWRARYRDAAQLLRDAGIETVDEADGIEAYLSWRRQWQPYVAAFGSYLVYGADEIDPAATPGASTSPDTHSSDDEDDDALAAA